MFNVIEKIFLVAGCVSGVVTVVMVIMCALVYRNTIRFDDHDSLFMEVGCLALTTIALVAIATALHYVGW